MQSRKSEVTIIAHSAMLVRAMVEEARIHCSGVSFCLSAIVVGGLKQWLG